MYTNRKTNTKKQKAYDFYNSYHGEKVSRPTFYYRVRLGGEEMWEDKIKARARTYSRRENAPKGKRAEELMRYNNQPEPKASKTLFRNRLNAGYTKEKAILIGDERLSVKRKKPIYKPQQVKTYVPKKKEIKALDDRDFKIEITYPKEVARIFRKEYQNMIEQIEWELTYTEEKTEIGVLNEKLSRLQDELACFNSYNK